jgi:glyoxylase-like metal-dependent hydrolase (beta-lactamase superfamily II)
MNLATPEFSTQMSPRITRHPAGITAVDAEYVRPGHAAVHIVEQDGRAAFVDTGTNHSVPYALAALGALGIAREAVDYILLTHVHLDHAGGAGLLLQSLPNARVLVHPRGSAHMIDPAKLVAGSILVYGEESFHELYGDIVPIPAERIVAVPDGERIRLGSRQLELIHTPGHALHHYCIVDAANASIFTGDTFGLSYRHFDTERGAFIIPTCTPTQFDPQQLLASMDRLLAYAPQSLYLTHYSRVTDIPRLADSLKYQLDEIVTHARAHAGAADRDKLLRRHMLQLWLRLLGEHGCTLGIARMTELLEADLDLNVQGLAVWLDRQKKG